MKVKLERSIERRVKMLDYECVEDLRMAKLYKLVKNSMPNYLNIVGYSEKRRMFTALEYHAAPSHTSISR